MSNILKIYDESTSSWVYIPALTGPGVPSGGTSGQVLIKASSTDYDSMWGSVGDVVGPASAVDNNVSIFNSISGKLIKDSGKAFSTDGTFADNSDAKIPTEKAVKTYADTLGATKAAILHHNHQARYPATVAQGGDAEQSNFYSASYEDESQGAATLVFHRPNAYAVAFGLDTDNNLKIGGWSMGTVSRRIWHEGFLEIRSGTITLNNTTWTSATFASQMRNAPSVIVTPNTENSGVIAVKTKNITTSGFQAIIGGSTTFTGISCNYVAVWANI